MSIFDHLIEIVVEHPVISGSFGAFLAAIISALFGVIWLAIVFVIVGVVVIYFSNK
jgi:uncharacterized membrane protein